MGKVKQAQQDIIDICAVLYGKLGVAGVCDHVNQELINRNPDYVGIVQYKHCTGCDADMPSIGDICLCCGQETFTCGQETITEAEGIKLKDGKLVIEAKFSPVPLYFKIVQQGWNGNLQREEVEINCGENGKLLLIKTEQGFIIDVYGQEKHICTNTVWEDDLESSEYYEIDEEADCLSIKTCEHKKNGKCFSKDACNGKIVEN
jgi:hypothetical protein